MEDQPPRVDSPRSMTHNITVRSTTDSASDAITVELPLLARVKELKEVIFMRHPRHPHPAAQRLIFGGRVLDDMTPLTNVFAHFSTVDLPTVHLIISALAPPPVSRFSNTESPVAAEPPTLTPNSGAAEASPTSPRRVIAVPCVYVNGVPYAITKLSSQPTTATPLPASAAPQAEPAVAPAPPAAPAANPNANWRLAASLLSIIGRSIFLTSFLVPSSFTTTGRVLFFVGLLSVLIFHEIVPRLVGAQRPQPQRRAPAEQAEPPGGSAPANALRFRTLMSIVWSFFVTLLPFIDFHGHDHDVNPPVAQGGPQIDADAPEQEQQPADPAPAGEDPDAPPNAGAAAPPPDLQAGNPVEPVA